MKKFSMLVGKSLTEIETIAQQVGKAIAKQNHELIVVFNYEGMLKLVGDAFKKSGGKLTIIYTENDYDWEIKPYMHFLQEADKQVKFESWHDMLLSLVKDSDVVICAGLSAGVLAELGYMEWNFQENKGRVKTLIGIKELLRNQEFPPEATFDMNSFMKVISVKDLSDVLKEVTS